MTRPSSKGSWEIWRRSSTTFCDRWSGWGQAGALLVSLADKVHNARSILEDYRTRGEEVWSRFSGGRDGTLWYYGELLKVYQEKAPVACAPLVKDVERIQEELTALALR